MNRNQAVLIHFITALPLEKQPGLLYGDRVVVVTLHNQWGAMTPLLDQDASRTQALCLDIVGWKVIRVGYISERREGDLVSRLSTH